MKERTAQGSEKYVGIYPEDLFSDDWWSTQVGVSDQIAIERI